MIMSIAIGAPAGYALSRFEFRGKELFRLLILLTRAFPLPLLALPLAVMFIRTGIDDTVFGLALVHTTLAIPFAVLITFSLFSGIPIELEEAAWTLGCNRLTAFQKVVLPLVLPGITASAIFAFVISWNEVFAAAVLTIENRTLTAFLLTNLETSPLHLKFAGGVHSRRTGADLHLRRAQIPFRDVGHRQPLTHGYQLQEPKKWLSLKSRTSRSALDLPGAARHQSDNSRPGIHGPAGRFGLRQIHAAADHMRAGNRDRGRGLDRRASGWIICPPKDRGISMVFPELRRFPASDGV